MLTIRIVTIFICNNFENKHFLIGPTKKLKFQIFENPLNTLVRYPKKIYTYVQIFNMKSDSSGDIHLAHIEKKNKSLEPLTYERIAIVFQPTARAIPAHTKTNRRCVHKL